MKRKPDMIFTLIIVFCLGLAVTGVASLERSSDRSSVRLTMVDQEPSEMLTTTR